VLRLSHDTHILVTLVLGTFNIGVLISYDTDYAYLFRRAENYLDKILERRRAIIIM